MKAMIFAAGLGTRLGKMTRDRPKALADAGGITLLEAAVARLAAAGFNDIIINVHHFAGMVREKAESLNSGSLTISISDETDRLLDTGGGLFRARHFFDDKPFILFNVDIVTDLNLEELYSRHLQSGGLATLAVRHREGDRYLLVDENGMLRGWTSRKNARTIVTDEELTLSRVAFSGIHVVSPEIFPFMDEGVYSMTGLYLSLAATKRINTFLHDGGYWFDAGTPEAFERCRNFLVR
jgi:NDP-sugar pyrophosphorylase family protein